MNASETTAPASTSFFHDPCFRAGSILLLAGLLAFANGFSGQFVFDDDLWIVNNTYIDNLPHFLTIWPTRPLVVFSVFLNHKLWNQQVAGYHAFNFAIHYLAALTLFGIVRRTLLLPRWNGKFESSAIGLALAAALLWMIHPLQTQSVTYIIQRCESMMGLGYLGTLYCLIRRVTGRHPWLWAGAGMACFLFGSNSKEVIFTAPVVLLLYDRVFLADSFKEIVRNRWKFYLGLLALSGRLYYQMYSAIHSGNAETSTIGFNMETGVTPWTYLLTQSQVVLHYLSLSFWPNTLVLDYQDWPIVQSWKEVLVPGGIVMALLLATAILLAFRSWLGFLGAWFFIILAPTSSIIPVADVAFEHRLYLPLAALVVLVVISAHLLFQRLLGAAWGKAAMTCVASLLAVFLIGRTMLRNTDYYTPARLWGSVLESRPKNARAATNYATAKSWEDTDENLAPLYLKAIEINPGDALNHLNLAIWLMQKNHHDKAGPILIKLTEQDSLKTNAELPYYLGLYHVREGQWEKANLAFRRAFDNNPGQPRYLYAYAAILEETDFLEKAKTLYAQGLKSFPYYPAQMNQKARGILMDEKGLEISQARQALLLARQGCCGENCTDPAALDTLSLALAANGRYEEAETIAQKALELARTKNATDWITTLKKRVEDYKDRKALWKLPKKPEEKK